MKFPIPPLPDEAKSNCFKMTVIWETNLLEAIISELKKTKREYMWYVQVEATTNSKRKVRGQIGCAFEYRSWTHNMSV